MQSAVSPTPWYRQFWPWFIMALPASAVVAGITTVIIATQNQDSLVADDYYKEGLAINQSIERDQVAARMGLSALVRFDSTQQQVSIQLSSIEQATTPASLNMTLTHPTLDQLDQKIELRHRGGGIFIAELLTLSSGEWHITIEPDSRDWRLTHRANLSQQGQVRISSQE